MVTFQRTALLRFYDDKEDAGFKHRHRGAHVSAITGVLGEELLLGLFLDCLRRQTGENAVVLKGKPRRRGNWLDAWVQLRPGCLGQVEIKNWSAHSLGGGKSLPITAPQPQIEAAAKARWKRYFGKDHDKMPSGAKKVLHDYDAPSGTKLTAPVERILCFWQPLSQNGSQPLSKATICGKEITVFSASIYLRQVDQDEFELDCPNMEERLRILDALQRPLQPAAKLRAVA